MSQVHEIPFKGARILGVKHDGRIFVPIYPICKDIGIDAQAQQRRIWRDPILRKGSAIIAVPSDGGPQYMICLPLNRIHYWLAGISVGHIKDEAMRLRVIEYQEECADVLFAYFMPEFAQALGIKMPTLKARLLQDDLLDRASPSAPAPEIDLRPTPKQIEDIKAAVVEALISTGIAKRDDIWRANGDLDYKIEKQLKPIMAEVHQTNCAVVGMECDLWTFFKRNPDDLQNRQNGRTGPTASGLPRLVKPRKSED